MLIIMYPRTPAGADLGPTLHTHAGGISRQSARYHSPAANPTSHVTEVVSSNNDDPSTVSSPPPPPHPAANNASGAVTCYRSVNFVVFFSLSPSFSFSSLPPSLFLLSFSSLSPLYVPPSLFLLSTSFSLPPLSLSISLFPSLVFLLLSKHLSILSQSSPFPILNNVAGSEVLVRTH